MKFMTLARQDLLFHPVHGLCRVDKVTERRGSGGPVLCYSLVPRAVSKTKVRFEIAAPDLTASGFHKVISSGEAKKILAYLRAGDSSSGQADQTWALARNILSFSKDKLNSRDQRKRQLMDYSVRGLVREFACVLGVSLQEAAQRIRQKYAA